MFKTYLLIAANLLIKKIYDVLQPFVTPVLQTHDEGKPGKPGCIEHVPASQCPFDPPTHFPQYIVVEHPGPPPS
jgi:hypothetical protein